MFEKRERERKRATVIIISSKTIKAHQSGYNIGAVGDGGKNDRGIASGFAFRVHIRSSADEKTDHPFVAHLASQV